MSTSVDVPHDVIDQFISSHSHLLNGGAMTSRGSITQRQFNLNANSHRKDGSQTARHAPSSSQVRLSAIASATSVSHGIPPIDLSSLSLVPLGSLSKPRTWENLLVREVDDLGPGSSKLPRRYLSQRMRRVVYGGNYWSAPMRTAAQRARGLTEDSVTIKGVERKLLPVPELIARIEEQQAILARQAEEARLAPIKAKKRLMMRQRKGIDINADIKEDEVLDDPDSEHVDLMSLLDHATLQLLKAEFLRHSSKALSLSEFVSVMRRYLPVQDIGEVAFTATLCTFFDSVDVNGDGTLEWNEFTNFITETGLSNSDPTLTSSSSSSSSAMNGSATHETVEEYKQSSLVDDFPWTKQIEKLFYFPAIDHVVVCQAHTQHFTVLRGKKLTPVAPAVHGHTSDMLSSEYIDRFGWVCTSANDRSIRFWDAADHYKPIRNMQIKSDHSHIALRWTPQQGILFTATDQKQIQAYRIERGAIQTSNSNTGTVGGRSILGTNDYSSSYISSSSNPPVSKLNPYSTELVSTFSGQNDISLDLLLLDNMSSLASGSLDTTIALFDINTYQRTALLKNGHQKGVFQLAYHSNYHVLVSAAFEHSAIVWNPQARQSICRLKGHYNPLIGVQTVDNSPQILTADDSGIVKIFDIRNFSCVQTLYIEDDNARVNKLSSFVCLSPHRRIISSSHKLFVHDSLTSSSYQAPTIADLDPTIKCLYNKSHGTFISASGQSIKIWTASSGILERVYRNIIPEGEGEISALALDDAEKKIITGDTLGCIRVFNYLNGFCMKLVKTVPEREITGLYYIPQLKNILSTHWDGSISLWDENQEEGILLLKKFQSHNTNTNASKTSIPTVLSPRSLSALPTSHSNGGNEIITSCYSDNLSLFCVGSACGIISLWDFRSHVLISELLGHASEITALTFLDPYPLLVSADTEGNVCFWVVRPLVINIGKCILRLINTTKGKPAQQQLQANSAASPTSAPPPASSSSGSEICPVTALAFWTNVDARSYLAAHHGDQGAKHTDNYYALVSYIEKRSAFHGVYVMFASLFICECVLLYYV